MLDVFESVISTKFRILNLPAQQCKQEESDMD